MIRRIRPTPGAARPARPMMAILPVMIVPVMIVVAMIVVAMAMLVGPQPAAGQSAGCSPLDRGGTRCRIGDGDAAPPPAPGQTSVSSSSPPGPRFVWLSIGLACEAAGSTGWTPIRDLASAIFDFSLLPGAGAPTEPGVLWIGELIDPATGPTNSGFISCVGAGSARPAPPPPPPTAAEIWGAALTFEPSVNLDPYVRGLTGLETYLWYEGPTSDTVSLTLNGYGVTARIAAVEFRWDMGGDGRDGERRYSSPTPGSAAVPAAAHTFALPAPVVVVHETVWTGSAVLTGPGLPAGGVVVDLGQAVLSTARAYDVIEVRTPVVGG